MRYFVNFGSNDAELMASRYDVSFRPGGNEIRPEYIALSYSLMATMVIPSEKYDDLGAWCAAQGLSAGEVPEEMFCHFRTDTAVRLGKGRELGEKELRLVPGWDPANDRDGDGKIDDEEFDNLANPEATAREMKEARIPMYYWGPPRDDYVMNIGHPDYQRYLAERHMPQQLAGGFDGFFVDTTPADVPGSGRGANVLEYPRGPGEDDAWMRDMQMAMAKVKIALPDSVLTANGWIADPFVLDGMERETGWLTITMSGRRFETSLESTMRLDRRGKMQLLQYNPSSARVSRQRDAIFGLAGYYLLAGDYTYYGYGRHPYGQVMSWYNPAADFDIGKATGPYEKMVLRQSEPSQGENLVANGDFEMDDDADGKPDGWSIAEPLELVEDVVKSGKRAVKIVSDSVQINNINKCFVTLKPNTAYTLSAWVKTEDITGGRQGAELYLHDFEDAQGGTTILLQGTNDWTQVSQIFTTGDDTWGRVTFRVYGATGTVWFDDIRIVEGVFADTILYTRRFSNALVVVRPSQPALGWGDDTAIEYALDGTYRPLQADGTLGDPIEKGASLRLGEAAILIPVP